ncbi:hypothetical protein J4727_15540 [Providencia rettgeri]|uniref:Uncharacterized protein n=1 Tax=Providencia rettgeri TaxID=587 RepID=A0A939NB74_PRORE|nr:hypothetical protein [Providencia rettgeri]
MELLVKGDTLHNTYGSIAANVENNTAARDIDVKLKATLNNNYGEIKSANSQKLDVGTLETIQEQWPQGKSHH